MSRGSIISDRRNNRFDRPNEPERAGKPPIVHLFAQKEEMPLLVALEQELANRSYEYRFHSDEKELKPIVEAPLRKIYAVVSLEGSNTSLPSNFKIGSNKMVRICTLGGQGLGSPERPNFQRVEDVIRAIDDFTIEEPATIRLASVHSIKVSKDKRGASSKDIKQAIKQVATNTNYDKAYYFKNYRGQYMPDEDKLYEDLVELLEREGSFQPFKSSRELQKKKQPVKNKKNLVLASANEASIQVIKELKKAKVNHFHFILLGRLNPCQQYLDDSVILASSDRRAIVDFLYNINIINIDVATRLNTERMQPVSNRTENVKAVPYLQITQSKIVPGESSKIQEEPQKKKIRKIKSPAKSKASNIQPEHPDHDTSHSNINVNIVISKHKDEPIVQNDEFYTNKQGQRISKKQSTKESDKQEPPQIQPYQSSGNYFDARVESMNNPSSRYDAMAPGIENQFSAKKASNIQSKYRNPSVIIQEMSDQYRGSNKESIMNLQPQKPRTDQPSNVNEPLEEISIKKVVSKGPIYANQPETHYISSNKTIQYSKTNPAISDTNINANSNYNITSNYDNYGNMPKYVSPASPRVYSGSPITISAGVASSTTNGASNTRVYGRPAEGYQSPSRVIRKEVSVPEEIVDTDDKREENRLTFGSNFVIPPPTSSSQAITYNNTLNYTSTNGNTTNNYRAPQTISSSYSIQQQATSSNYNIQPAVSSSSYNNQAATSSSYYTPQTFNYHTLHNEPYNSKIHVSPGRVEQVITNTQKPTQQVRNYTSTTYNNYLASPKIDDKGTKQFIFNSDDYEQIERDGRIVYRKKMPVQATRYTPINYVSGRVEKVQKQEDDGSPAVKRYETSPLRREVQTTNAYDYIRSNSPQTHTYDYNKLGNNTYSSKNYEVITVPYKTDDHNLGQMIESSHKKKSLAENVQTITINSKSPDSKNFVGVTYRNEDRSGISNYYKDTGVKVYGVSQRVEVERVEQPQPKVQAANPIPVTTPKKPKLQPIKINKVRQDQKGQLSPALTPKNALNESNWFSRMSQLHSDGSILRRNNIRFGVKLQKREQRPQGNSVVENKMVSGIFKLNDLNKKMALNRIIQGEEYIEEQREKYSHINPSLNRFHFLIQEDLDYLQPTITKYLMHSQDRADSFTGVNSLFAVLNAHSDSFDLGFVFARQEEMNHINPALMPENYFLVSIEGDEGLLEINQAQKRVRIDQLRHFPLVQRIILDSQLYQYVAYRNSRPEVELLADKFVNSEFILEKIETAFTTEILDCYYYELPRLTRLYVLCDQSELPGLLSVVQAYSEVNSAFKPETCKLVCVLSNILGNDELIMAHPTVTFISNPEEITHFRHILGYAHHYDAPDPAFLPVDHLFYHVKHVGLEQQLVAHYPGRFLASPFSKVAEVYSKVEKMTKIAIKNEHQPKVYLVLHESVNAEKVRVEYFTKIFMLGKAKVVQNKVVRVMNTEELLELLKK